MVQQETLQQPQEEITEQIAQPGPIENQVATPDSEAQPGVEAKESPKTYSHDEWDQREKAHNEEKGKIDQQLGQARQAIASNALRQQIFDAENKSLAEDSQSVEDGEMTQRQANQRQHQRQETIRQQMHSRQILAQERAKHAELVSESEELARWRVADILAKEHGVDADALLADKTLTAEKMEIKAERLALEKERASIKGVEKFDSGQQGSVGVSTANMSAVEKINYGLAHPPKRSR
jgi:hypothetical protein